MPHPLLYELNTRCWLRELSDRYGRPLTLATVPVAEFEAWARSGFTHIWLMGVWTSGPRARAVALADAGLRKLYSEILGGWQEADISGSPYAIADYHVPGALGGDEGLQEFRRRARSQGLKLLLDFVPNHLGLDHPWIGDRPGLFVQSPTRAPETFPQDAAGSCWLAHGKDPNFAAWADTVQLDYRLPATRAAMTALLQSVAARCDGVRCDMAMLLLNEVFARTWQRWPPRPAQPTETAPPPATEFWADAIAAVKQAHPGFILLAEAYWGLESRLRALGFDYTYDKELYDKLIGRAPGAVQTHLLGLGPQDLAASAHFLENHDEPRVASLLSLDEQRAAALLILGLPGMRFLHAGQLTGARIRLPVQLARCPVEPEAPSVAALYQSLLTTLAPSAVGQGSHALLRPRAAWPGNPTAQNFVVVQWQTRPPDFDLVVVNLAPHRSQCYAPLTAAELAAHNWAMNDQLGPERYVRCGTDLQSQGLYLDLPPHGAQLFHFAVTA